MQRAARIRVPQEFERPAGLAEEELCRISYRKPVDGCPVYTELFKEGDEVQVKVIDIDDTGRVRLSRKAVIMEAPDYDPAVYAGMGAPAGDRPQGERRPDRDRGGRDRGRGGPRDRGRDRGHGGGGRH